MRFFCWGFLVSEAATMNVRPIKVIFDSDSRLHYNTSEAAAVLGMSRQFLTELASKGRESIYAPSGKFGIDNIYPRRQVQIISLVMRGKLSDEEGAELWRRIQDRELTEIMTDAGGFK